MRVGYILPPRHLCTAEELAGLKILRAIRGVQPSAISSAAALRRLDPRTTPLIWLHSDREEIDSVPLVDRDAHAFLRSFLESGGSILLSLMGARLAHDLRVEPIRPTMFSRQPWGRKCWAEGYPDIRGFSSYRGHPLFTGLGGAVFTWSPTPAHTWCGALYEAPASPHNGQVVAVERQYITVNEGWRLITEHSWGAGTILCIGSFLFFDEPVGRCTPHRDRFLQNCIQYLTHRDSRDQRKTIWSFAPTTVTPVEAPEAVRPIRHRKAPVPPLRNDLTLHHPVGPDAPFDTGGRRMLVMGSEHNGIEEIWCHPFRVVHAWEVRLRTGGDVILLNSLLTGATNRPESFTRHFSHGSFQLNETVFTDVHAPIACIHYRGHAGSPLTLRMSTRLDLRMMWPLSAQATGPLEYANHADAGLNTMVVTAPHAGLTAILGVRGNHHHMVSCFIGRDTEAREVHDKSNELTAVLEIETGVGDVDCLIVLTGSSASSGEAWQHYRRAVANPGRILTEHVRHWNSRFRALARILTPDEEFNRSTAWALVATDRFAADVPGVGTSYMAGYATTAYGWNGGQQISGRPGYAWFFGRDCVWTALAALHYGDRETVRESLRFLGDHQDITGKILHELTTSGHCHYDAADATPLYCILMGRYLHHSRDVRFVREQFPRLRKAIAFCLSTDADGDHLIENTSVGHGWVEGGQLFPAHAEIYLTSCWAEALRESAYIAHALGASGDARDWNRRADRVLRIINADFWNPETLWYNFAKNADGSFNPERTILPAVSMLFGQTSPQNSSHLLTEYASADFSADWGARIVSRESRMYDPRGYHYGSVWPLFTGWAALAAFRYGRSTEGFQHLSRNLALSRVWAAGYTPEVIHGEQCLLEGVCAHQAWSSSMALQPLFEGMLGMRVDALNRSLSLTPYVPPQWKWLRARHLRCGTETLDISVHRTRNETVYTLRTTAAMSVTLGILLPLGATVRRISFGRTVLRREFCITNRGSIPTLELKVRGTMKVRVTHDGGFAVQPPAPRLSPGGESEGLRIIDERLVDGGHEIMLEGREGRTYDVVVSNPGDTPCRVKNAAVIDHGSGVLRLSVAFPGAHESGRFARQAIILSPGSEKRSHREE